MAEIDSIQIVGARQHNLKNIDLAIPKGKLVVFTGPSGAGKSTLAFDTIYAEGQRRYVESLSSYARQFLGQLPRPEVDSIRGLAPAIAVAQQTINRSPRSTVGTITEIYDHLRLLYARIGKPHCPVCGRAIEQQTASQIVDQILGYPDGTRLMILAPLVNEELGSHATVLEQTRRAGFVRVRVDGAIVDLDEPIELDHRQTHSIDVVVDRLIIRHNEAVSLNDHPDRVRVSDSVETALKTGAGMVWVQPLDGQQLRYSEHAACPEHGPLASGAIEPRTFSFNSPHGACPICDGLGTVDDFDRNLLQSQAAQTLGELLSNPLRASTTTYQQYWEETIQGLAEALGSDLEQPVDTMASWALDLWLEGTIPNDDHLHLSKKLRQQLANWSGLLGWLRQHWQQASEQERESLSIYRQGTVCSACEGSRLRPEARAVTLQGLAIDQVTAMSIEASFAWVHELPNKLRRERDQQIAAPIVREMGLRLQFLREVGLDYLSLARTAESLSGGEAQRIQLATHIGAGLSGVLYVLDEPSIGLHPRDTERLLHTLLQLRDLGNSVLVVEHEPAIIAAADWVVEVGPTAGVQGGYIMASGTLEHLMAQPNSQTGQYLAGQRQLSMPQTRRKPTHATLMLRGAKQHNLNDVDVAIPLGCLVAITGVSGSGKSTLIHEILYPRLANELHGSRLPVGRHRSLEGYDQLEKVIAVDQMPLGRSGRSNAATYTGIFDALRQLFAGTPEAKARGYGASRFSFNLKGGRCEQCRGEGVVTIAMQFLPDLAVTCDACGGLRYNRETLDIRYRGYTIADVLAMTVGQALSVFERLPALARKLESLVEVGLSYLTLGQPAATLSGGEAQRVKLAAELARRGTGRTLYILDEPTTGLYWTDVERLIAILQRLVDTGNSVVVIEHHLDLIKTADWVIDLGPEGGDTGGRLVVAGTPEVVAMNQASWTGRFLQTVLA